MLNDGFEKFLNELNISKNVIGEYSPLALAFLGDAVYEVFVRSYVLSKGNMSPHKLHILAADFVKAKSQAHVMHEITRYLIEDELEIIRRGRNAKSGTIPKNADVTDYRNATGLESLFGYLFLIKDFERLYELMKIAIKIKEEN